MDEREVIARIREELAGDDAPDVESLYEVERALATSSGSSELWVLRGILVQVAGDDGRHELSEALESFLRAIECDPASPEAYEEAGRYLDAVDDDPRSAEPFLRQAVALGGGESSREALASVLGQLGKLPG